MSTHSLSMLFENKNKRDGTYGLYKTENTMSIHSLSMLFENKE